MQKETPKNIFDDDYMKIKGQKYINAISDSDNDNFSWVSDADKKVLNLEELNTSGKNKGELRSNINDIRSINWGIPNMIIGDYKTAKFYLCLLNPRVQDATKEATNIQEYVEKETGKALKEIFDDEDQNNDCRDEYYSKKEDYSAHLINVETNAYYNELKKLNHFVKGTTMKDEYDAFSKKYKNVKKDDKSDYEKKHNPLRKMYYLHTYYNYLFRDQYADGKDTKGEVEAEIFDELNQRYEKNGDKISHLKICDLELFPYRTEGKPTGSLFKKGKSYKDLDSSKYVANIILDRVEKANLTKESDETLEDNPIFVFRSYQDWFKVLLQEFAKRKEIKIDEKKTDKKNLEDEKNSGKKDLEDKLLEQYLEETNDYFYEFSAPQNGSLSINNIKKATIKINNSEYKNIKAIFNAQ